MLASVICTMASCLRSFLSHWMVLACPVLSSPSNLIRLPLLFQHLVLLPHARVFPFWCGSLCAISLPRAERSSWNAVLVRVAVARCRQVFPWTFLSVVRRPLAPTPPGTVRSMWRGAVGGLLALLAQRPWHQQHQQHRQQHLLSACHCINFYSLTVSPAFGSACQSLSPVDNSVARPLIRMTTLHLIFPVWSSLSSSIDSLLDFLVFSHSHNFSF